jgi:hypothetical protein
MGDKMEREQIPPVPRGKPSGEGRFVWAASSALERIVNELGATDAAFGIAVYVGALCRLSSKNKGNPQIECSIQVIAGMARISYPKALATLNGLESAGVISITRREREKGQTKQPPHTYTLLSLRRNTVKPARRNDIEPADETEVARHYSENPKDSPFQGESLKKEPPVADGNAAVAHPVSTGVLCRRSVVTKGLPE